MSSEETTGQIPDAVFYEAWHEYRYPGTGLDADPSPRFKRAMAVINTWLAGKAVVDLPEPDDILDRLSGPEVGFRGRGWTVRASNVDEPRVSISMGDYLSGGYGFKADQVRPIAAALLAAERLSVPGEARNGQ